MARGIPPGTTALDPSWPAREVVAGLIVERVAKARARPRDSRVDESIDICWAVERALDDAFAGRRPTQLRNRLPAPLAARIATDFRGQWCVTFQAARLLELYGLLALEPDERYVGHLLDDLLERGRGSEAAKWCRSFEDPVDWFTMDPALVDRGFWPGFRLELPADQSFRRHGWNTSWLLVTLRMIERSMITRQQVIDESLSALNRDLSSATVRYFLDLLDTLEPTLGELTDRQRVLRQALGARIAVTTKACLRWLKQLEDAGLLDDAETAPALAPVLEGSAKTTAMASLSLLERVHGRTPTAEVVTAARVGLAHPNAEVQLRAARFLLALGEKDVVIAEAELLEPSVRAELAISLTALPEGPLIEVGLDAMAGATPVGDHDLAERLAALLEGRDDPYELELVLDRLARPGAAELIAPLTKRARRLCERGPGNYESVDWLVRHLGLVVLDASGSLQNSGVLELDRASHHRRQEDFSRQSLESGYDAETRFPTVVETPGTAVGSFLFQRLLEVREILAGSRRPGALLATPTEECGFIDPEALVERLLSAPIRRHDLIAAALRIGVDNRSAALKRWLGGEPALPTEHWHAVAYALGGPSPDISLVRDHGLWVACARSRAAFDDDPLLLDAGLVGAGRGHALRLRLDVTPPVSRADYGYNDFQKILTMVPMPPSPARSRSFGEPGYEPGRPGTCLPDQPTAVSQRALPSGPWDPADADDEERWLGWAGLLYPHDAEHLAAVSLHEFLHSTLWKLDRTEVLDAFGRHRGRLGPLTAACLATALAATSAEFRIATVDVIAAMLGRRQLSTRLLADGMVTVSGYVVLSRWAVSLPMLAQAGHGPAVIEILTGLLPKLDPSVRGLHGLLDVLHQELLRAGRRVDDQELTGWLSRLTGSGKAARSARQVLEL